jgi:SAM-dependent methyltransferase
MTSTEPPARQQLASDVVEPGSWITDAGDSYDRVADRYAELVRSGLDDLPLERRLVDHFAHQVVAAGGGPVLDVGCGPGRLTHDLASRGLAVTGIDVSSAMLRLARSHDPGLRLVAASLTRLPVADNAIAGVFCWYVLHHVPDEELRPSLGELARVLAPGGSLMIGGHVGDSTYVKTEGYGGIPMRVLFARRSPATYADLLRDVGLDVDATVALGPDHPAAGAIWLARKPR